MVIADEYHGEHHHRYQNLHAVGDQDDSCPVVSSVAPVLTMRSARAKVVIHQEHGQIHAEHHGRVIESQDLLNKGKVLAHPFSCLVRNFFRLSHRPPGQKDFTTRMPATILLYRVI